MKAVLADQPLTSNDLISDFEFSRRLIDLQERFDFEYESMITTSSGFSLF